MLSNLAVLEIFLIQLFSNWTAYSPVRDGCTDHRKVMGGVGLSWVAWIFFLWTGGARIFFVFYQPFSLCRKKLLEYFFAWFSTAGIFFFCFGPTLPITFLMVRPLHIQTCQLSFHAGNTKVLCNCFLIRQNFPIVLLIVVVGCERFSRELEVIC